MIWNGTEKCCGNVGENREISTRKLFYSAVKKQSPGRQKCDVTGRLISQLSVILNCQTTPLHSTPLHSTPLHSTPLHSYFS